MVGEGQTHMYRERALAQAQWESKNIACKLDNRGISHPNPLYVKRELVDGKVVETMPNKIIEVKEEK